MSYILKYTFFILFALIVIFSINANAAGNHNPPCTNKVLEQKTIQGQYLGWFEKPDSVGEACIKDKDTGKRICADISEGESEIFGNDIGAEIVMRYEKRQFSANISGVNQCVNAMVVTGGDILVAKNPKDVFMNGNKELVFLYCTGTGNTPQSKCLDHEENETITISDALVIQDDGKGFVFQRQGNDPITWNINEDWVIVSSDNFPKSPPDVFKLVDGVFLINRMDEGHVLMLSYNHQIPRE